MTIAVENLMGRSLVPGELFGRLANRIVREHDLPRESAERIMDQTLAFLRACGESSRVPLGPSALVDIGWHTFILYTREYASFCDRVAGRFIHHVPNDEGDGVTDQEKMIARTVEAIRALGFAVDDDLWLTSAVKCSDGDDGCRASGKDGNENTETNGK
ncbi:hypothetical protein CFP71_14295 [Amycolatopsis thailandensis]|uniref:Uncharacterized protein n=1 Tax=Amycolatopsis thailandensis TaxID=589330 RepID=A0A229SB82_9PSEU|nr:hypothetical protein [Amycolatopsis thailandensis]OXM56176.1 hypothetical protein CFP71_14295 [Amycolatopsis thailandensis]